MPQLLGTETLRGLLFTCPQNPASVSVRYGQSSGSSQPSACAHPLPLPVGKGLQQPGQVLIFSSHFPHHLLPTRPFLLLLKQSQEQESHQEAFLKTGCFREYTYEGAKPQIACGQRWHALLKALPVGTKKQASAGTDAGHWICLCPCYPPMAPSLFF